MADKWLVTTEDKGDKPSPYGSALMVDEEESGQYSIVIPLEAIPSVSGEPETFPYNVLTEPSKGNVKGKEEMEAGSTNFFYTKENCERLDKLKGKILPYMTLLSNGIGVKFHAELSYRLNDIENSDIIKGTLTLTPSSLDGQVLEASSLIKPTEAILSNFPTKITFNEKTAYSLPAPVSNSDTSDVTVETVLTGAASDKYSVSEWSDNKITITPQEGVENGDKAMLAVNLSSKSKTYAPWTYFVDLDYEEV